LVVPPDEELPGGLEADTSLDADDLAAARSIFSGSTVAPGAVLGNAVVLATGQTLASSPGEISEQLTLNDQDFQTVEPGGLIGLYWFPGVSGTTVELPEGVAFEMGGLQQSSPDPASEGDIGMTVPTNPNPKLTIAFYDRDLTTKSTSLPPTRFQAIEIVPSGYQLWREQKFLPAQIETGEAAPDSDPDEDGLPNLIEYATGSEPQLPSPNPLHVGYGGGSLSLEFNRISDPDLRYRVESTADLSSSSWSGLIFESTGAQNLMGSVNLLAAIEGPMRFYRLRVEPAVPGSP
jgi:hypothetical protein